MRLPEQIEGTVQFSTVGNRSGSLKFIWYRPIWLGESPTNCGVVSPSVSPIDGSGYGRVGAAFRWKSNWTKTVRSTIGAGDGVRSPEFTNGFVGPNPTA